MKRLSARAHLLMLIAAATVPLWFFAAYLLAQYTLTERSRFEREAVQVARQVSLVVEGELGNMFTVLDVLSKSASLTTGDLEALHLEAQRLATPNGRTVFLSDMSGKLLFNTQVAYGATLPPVVDLRIWPTAEIDARKHVVSDVYSDRVSGGFRIAVAIPVEGPAGSEWLLAVNEPTSRLRDVMLPAVPSGWTVGIGDSKGSYVARSQKHEEMTGQPGLPEYVAKIVGQSGTFTSRNFEGLTLLAGYYRSNVSDWFYTANVALSVVQEPLWNSLLLIALAGLSAAFVSVALAYFVGRRIASATAELAARALALGQGRPTVPIATSVEEFGLIADAMTAAERALAERTSELQTVLETAPVAVWFTYDPSGRQVIRNRFAAELMGLTDGPDLHFGAPDAVIETVALKDGQSVSRDDRPLTKAMRGLETDNEEFSYILPNGVRRTLLTSARSIRDSNGKVVGAVQASLDISDRKRGEEHRRLLVKELNHRVKNTLAVVQSIANQTLRGATDLQDATKALSGRLISLAKAHDILTQENWDGADLAEVVSTTLEPHADLERFEITGPSVRLSASTALSLSMALHELATNAIKYGSLSAKNGKVIINWAVEITGAERRLQFTWRETGGPKVVQTEHRGFGMRLLKRMFTAEPGGSVDLSFDPDGLRASLYADIGAVDSRPLS